MEANEIRDAMEIALKEALKARQADAIAALRSALGAIANAEAVDEPPPRVTLGVGTGDVARRKLAAGDVIAILHAEIDERSAAAGDYERLGQRERARSLRAEAAILADYVDPDEARR